MQTKIATDKPSGVACWGTLKGLRPGVVVSLHIPGLGNYKKLFDENHLSELTLQCKGQFWVSRDFEGGRRIYEGGVGSRCMFSVVC